MLTRIIIRKFKLFDEVELELGERVVLVGPNNSGKTSALQALALWDIGVKRWVEKRGNGEVPEKRPGVTINRRDLIAVPVPAANLLWRDLRVRESTKSNSTQNVRVEISVSGVSGGGTWTCGLEFDYANEESFYCRTLRLSGNDNKRMEVPAAATGLRIAYLPPMSGLAANETRLDEGAINVRLGEGRTAEVLRNLCYQITDRDDGDRHWNDLTTRMEELFGIQLEPPEYLKERGEITLSYKTRSKMRLDISSTGRGLQQTLLLLAHMIVNPGAVLLLDEPDAHLEILRQRQIYQLLADKAAETGSQIIAASHSEVILNEAADRDLVIAFVGRPHRIDDRGSQVLKALKELGFEEYYKAEQMGWVLYVEGSTDLAILLRFAERLEHPAKACLEQAFVHYVANQPSKARDHFYGLKEAKGDLAGIAIYDRLPRPLSPDPNLVQLTWRRREIENYLCTEATLLAYAEEEGSKRQGPIFAASWRSAMVDSIAEIRTALEALSKPSPWEPDIKASDEFLDPLFERFYKKLAMPNLMKKSDYHQLAPFVPLDAVDPEIRDVLERIQQVASRAKPLGN
jgi:energy-coupling factor transporter ATP-binding protein EcfA2